MKNKIAYKIAAIIILMSIFNSCGEDEISKKPKAEFIYSVSGARVNFTNLCTDASSYLWTFGDGETSTEEDPTHTYDVSGTYSVILKATGQGGIDTQNQSIVITISSNIPSNNSTGSVLFWIKSDFGCGNITVILNGVSKTITSFSATATPNCDQPGFATFALAPGVYNYSASCTGKTWSSSVTVLLNDCNKIELVATPTGGTTATVTNPETIFLSNACYSMSKLGDWWVNGFSLSGTRTFKLRFSSRYKADAAIVAEAQVNNFKNNLSFTGYSVFDDKFGYSTVTLSAGNYYLAVRNQTSGENIFTVELDYEISLPSTDKCTFFDNYIKGVESLNAGGKLWHEFVVQKGFRYFIDGNNTGLNCYVIPANQLENFKNDLTFTYLSDYSDKDCALPGQSEYKLNEGSYYLVFHNQQSVPNTVNYLMERWKVTE